VTFTSSPNHFLCSLSPHDAALIEPHLRPVHLPRKTIFYNAEDILERVYFPYSGIISIVVAMSGGNFVEAGMLGRNGVVGAGSALDGRWALNTAISQADSSGMTIDSAILKRLAGESETIRSGLASQEQALFAQTQQVAACNALHEVEERLSRWLLHSYDLLETDTLPLTQELLSQMLGVRRTSVTLVASRLQQAGLIKYRRGHIQVLDVEGLQDSCCECYAVINTHFSKLIGWSPNGLSAPA
jgi:CRP-like cAMP-binding protein